LTDSAYSLLLFSALVAGPASAFLLDIQWVPLLIVFPLLALFTPARRGMARLTFLAVAPVFVLLWGLIEGDQIFIHRGIRWAAAVFTGAAISGALGTSRASSLLFALSKRVRFAGLTESLAMVVSLAGPCARSIRNEFSHSRRNGMDLTDSFARALESVHEDRLPLSDRAAERNSLSMVSGVLAWLIMLAAVSGVLS